MAIYDRKKIKLSTTPLKELHLELGARMVPFAGYEMPVSYSDGIKKEHLHTRKLAGLFDVSHMGQITVTGDGAARALETLVPINLEDLSINKQAYALLTDEKGGILDDLMIVRWSKDCFFLQLQPGLEDLRYLHPWRKHSR